jgi:formylglycine-generating enzyme required for sulfatase activity
MRSCFGWIVAAACLTGEAAAQQHPPHGGGGGSVPQRRYHWWRYGGATPPAEAAGATAEELAVGFGLESIGPQGPDGIAHYRHGKTGMLFVFVPGGSFPMGSNHGEIYSNIQIADSTSRGSTDQSYFDSEQPQTPIHVSPYFIAVYETTNAEYRQFLDALAAGQVPAECEWPLAGDPGNHVPALWGRTEYPFWGDRQPVVGITWLDAYAFARWMGGRLPTEAEWEKAARGTDGRVWPWGNRFDPMRANTAESSNHRTLDVGTYPGGRSVFGCYDMAGNVAEFCLDAYDDRAYRERQTVDPCLLEREPFNERKVIRGGRWNRFGYLHTARCAGRGQMTIRTRYPSVQDPREQFPITEYLGTGMRVVLSPFTDLFPDGSLAQIRAQQHAAEEARRQAIERRRAQEGRAPSPADDAPKKDGGEASGDGGGD